MKLPFMNACFNQVIDMVSMLQHDFSYWDESNSMFRFMLSTRKSLIRSYKLSEMKVQPATYIRQVLTHKWFGIAFCSR